jgi:hypothetical protein
MAHVYQLVTYCHSGGGNFFQNVFHYELSEAGSGVSPFNYADALNSTWITNVEPSYVDLFGNDVILDFISAKRITGGGGPTASRIRATNGTAAVISSTSGASMDIQWQTASPLNRPGHTYMCSFPYNWLQGDQFSGSAIAKVATFITAITAVLPLAGALGDAVFQIFTRKTDTGYTVDSGLLRPKPTVMGRRLLPVI